MDKKSLPNDLVFEDARVLLNEGREVCFTPKGTSMLPFIIGGRDTVTIKKLSDINKGDIVLAHLPDKRYVLHRVISIDGDKLTLMGDGNLVGTERCLKKDILGTAVRINRHKPAKGTLWRWLKPVRRYLLAIYRRLIRLLYGKGTL